MSRPFRMFRSSRDGPTDGKVRRLTPVRLGTVLIAAVGLLLGPVAIAVSAASTPRASTPVMGSYVSVTPFRISDTRPNSGQPNAGRASLPQIRYLCKSLGWAPHPYPPEPPRWCST